MVDQFIIREAMASIAIDEFDDGHTLSEERVNAIIFRKMPNGDLTSSLVYYSEFPRFGDVAQRESNALAKRR